MTATVQSNPAAADPARAQQGPGGVEQAIMELVPLLQQLGRGDLIDRATAAGARLKRPATIVTVVGEFKQGKSSLVNGLLGHDVCPVDDDLATSVITLVRHGEQAGAVVRRRVDGQPTAEQIPIDELQNWVSEQGNPENERQVERVELVLPSKILAQGLILVDTPGMGGLGAGHAAATTSFLPYADGLILTSDSSSELSANEIEFMAEATALCPTVMFAQTKTDLYPEWERIFDINRQHLTNRGLDVPMVAISSQLRLLALERKRRVLNDRSRFPELIANLKSQVIEPAKGTARRRSADDVTAISGMVRHGLERERQILAEPESVARSLAEMQEAKERLEHLRGPGARWNVIVNDRSSDLQSSTAHHFRSAMRTVSRELEDRIEELSSAQDWDVLSRDLQTMVGDVVTRAFLAIDQGHRSIRAEVVDLLEIEVPALRIERDHHLSEVDVLSLWSGKPIEEEAGIKDRFKTGVAGIRGAQGGVMMFGMLGRFLPAAAATVAASNPVLLGAGALFGGMQLMDDKKRKVTARRQAARQQVRQFVDDVQFEVGNAMTSQIRELQRQLRDEFTERLTELQATYTDTAQRAQQSAQAGQAEVQRRATELDGALQSLGRIDQLVQAGGAT